MNGYCKECTICDGRGCRNTIPGPGAKGIGDVAIRNYDKWKEVRINMDTLTEQKEVNTRVNIFGRELYLPLMAGPVGAVKLHYSDKYTDEEYNDVLIEGCMAKNIIAFTGDGTDPNVIKSAANSIAKMNAPVIPTIKPWDINTIKEKMEMVEKAGAVAIAMDVDAAGLPFLKGLNPPAGSKSKEELAEIISLTEKPFIVKGIMSTKGAETAVSAGAKGIVVSNHGGRVMDQCPSTCEVLSEIAEAIKGSECKVFVDGGLRDGIDVLKALALGADCVMMARPFVNVAYKEGTEGVKAFVEKIRTELEDAMKMCGVYSIEDIDNEILWGTKSMKAKDWFNRVLA